MVTPLVQKDLTTETFVFSYFRHGRYMHLVIAKRLLRVSFVQFDMVREASFAKIMNVQLLFSLTHPAGCSYFLFSRSIVGLEFTTASLRFRLWGVLIVKQAFNSRCQLATSTRWSPSNPTRDRSFIPYQVPTARTRNFRLFQCSHTAFCGDAKSPMLPSGKNRLVRGILISCQLVLLTPHVVYMLLPNPHSVSTKQY